MNAEHVQAFLQMAGDATFRQGFTGAGTPEAKRAFLDAAGLTLTVDEAESALAGEGELTDEELDQAAGAGIGIIVFPNP